jgi:hypothetical protein
MKNILSELNRIIKDSQEQLQSEFTKQSDQSEYWRGKIDGLFAVKTLLQMKPDRN